MTAHQAHGHFRLTTGSARPSLYNGRADSAFTAFLGFEVNEGEYKVMGMAFNLQGEPIVNTPAEAFNTSQRSGMDVLVLGDYVVEKPAAR